MLSLQKIIILRLLPFVKKIVAEWLWASLLLAGVFSVILWAEAGDARWSKLGVAPMSASFADWAAVLAAGEAWAAGADPWAVPNPYDPYGRPHVYGPSWLILGDLGLTVTDTWWSGTLLITAFIIVVARLLHIKSWSTCLASGLVMTSAPVLLAINRANNDIVIFMLLAASAWASGQQKQTVQWLAIFGLVAATLLKFYPAVALIAIFAMHSPWRIRIVRAAIALALLSVLTFAQWDMIKRSLDAVPNPSGWWAYDGKDALGLLWNVISGSSWPFITLGACAMLLPLLYVIRLAAFEWWRFLPAKGAGSFLVVASAMCWVGCLFAGSSYIYRAIWLLPVFGSLIMERKVAIQARFATGTLATLFLIISTQKQKALLQYQLHEGEKDTSRIFFAHGGEQVMLLGTALICLIILTGWAWRNLNNIGKTP